MKVTNLFGNDKLKQITDQFGEKQSYRPTYTINLPEGYTNLKWVDKIKDAVELNITNCKQITNLSSLEQLDNLTKLGLWDAEKFDASMFSSLSKILKLESLTIIGAEQIKEVKGISQMKLLQDLYLHALNCENFEEIAELKNLSKLHLITNKMDGIDFITQMKKLNHLEVRPAPIKDAMAIENFHKTGSYNSTLHLSLDVNAFLPSDVYGIKNVTLGYYHDDCTVNVDHLRCISGTESLTIEGSITNALLSELVKTPPGKLLPFFRSIKELNFVYFFGDNNIMEFFDLEINVLNKLENLKKVSFNDYNYSKDKFGNYIKEFNEAALKADSKAVAWAEKNTWYGENPAKTLFAYITHHRLEAEGFDLDSDQYYNELDKRISDKFSQQSSNAQLKGVSKLEGIPKPIISEALKFDVYSNDTQIYLSKEQFEAGLSEDKKKITIKDDIFCEYLDQYPTIEEIEISRDVIIDDFKKFLVLPSLNSLICRSKEIDFSKNLPQLTKLKHFTLIAFGTPQFDIACLTNLIDLERLDIDSYEIENMPLLENLINLRSFSALSCFQSINFKFAKSMPHLEYVGITVNMDEKVDLSYFSHVKDFTLVPFSNLFVYKFDFGELRPLTKMESLGFGEWFDYENATNYAALAELTSLKQLTLNRDEGEIDFNKIDLTALHQLSNLERLHLGGPFGGMSGAVLSGLSSLTELVFSYAYSSDDPYEKISYPELVPYLLKMKSLEEIVIYDSSDSQEDALNIYSLFHDILKKGIKVTLRNFETENFTFNKLAEHSSNLEDDYGILYQLKDANPKTDKVVQLVGQSYDKNSKFYAVNNIELLKHFESLEEFSLINDPDYMWDEESVDLAALSAHPRLKKLEIKVFFENIEFLNDLNQLQELSVLNYQELDETYSLETTIPTLKILRMQDSNQDFFSNNFDKFPNLEQVTIDYPEEYFDHTKLLALPALKKFSGAGFFEFYDGDQGMADLSSLENLEEIEQLRLLDYADFKQFKKLKKIPNLYIDEVFDVSDFVNSFKNIDIGMLGIGNLEGTPDDFPLLGHLSQSIKNIYVRGGNINEVGDLSFFANLKNLESLKIEHIYDWQKTVDIGQLGKLEHLRELHIDGNYDSENINPITELKGFPVLTDLKIGDLLNDLSEIKHLPALTRLTLTNPINIGMIQSAVPKLEILDFYANHISDLQPLSFLQSVKFLDISRVHKINDFTPIGKFMSLTRLKLDSCDLLTNINFLGKSHHLYYLEIRSQNFEESNKESKKRVLDLSPLSACKGSLNTLKLYFINTSVDLNSLPPMLALKEISLGTFFSIENLDVLSKLSNLEKIEFENIDTPIDLIIFSSMPNLKSLNFKGCNNIMNATYFDAIDGVEVSIEKSYTEIHEDSKKIAKDAQYIIDLETDWIRENIHSKGKGTNTPWLFETFKDKSKFEHFTKFLSCVAKKLGEAKSPLEQINLIVSAQYQYYSMVTILIDLNKRYDELSKQYLIQEFYLDYPFINSTNVLISGQCCMLINECLWDLQTHLMLWGEKIDTKKINYTALYENAMQHQKIYQLGKFEISIYRSKNKSLIEEQAKRLLNFDLNDFEKKFEVYANQFENLISTIANNDWNKTEINFDSVPIPDELTAFAILFEDIFVEKPGQMWLKKNEWCKKNYSLMRETQNIMNELIEEGYRIDEFNFYEKLDNRLSILKPGIFKDKATKTSKDVVSAEDIYDDNHLWRVIPDFTIAINLENQNPVFELFDCTDLVDISPLEQLPHLRELFLHYCSKLEDTSPIGKLVNLSKLEISMCGKLTDISPLANLKNLTHLNIRNASLLKDISPLKNNTKLKKLFLYGCKSIKDLSSLKGLKELEIVVIPHCRDQLPDLSPLLALPNLHEISLDNCTNAIDLSQLEAFENLESLLINHSGELTILPQFPLMPKLFRFALICSPLVSDIASLESLKILEVLHIDRSCWYLENLDPLQKLRHLRTLTLSECTHLDDISSIQKLPKLDDVDISGCPNLKNYNKEEFIRRPNIEEPQVIEEIDNELSNLTTSSSNIENIGDLLLPSGKLLVRDFDYLGYWGSGRGLSDHRHKSVVYFPKDTTVTIHIEKSKERVPLSILITPKDTNDLQNTHWKFAGYLICDGGGLIIVQDLLGMKKAKDDKKYQEYMDALTKDIGKEPEKDFLPTISQPGCLINNSYGSTLFPVFIKCNGLKQIERMIIDLDHLKVRRTLGAKGEVKDHLKQMQDYFFKSVTQENPNGPYFLITRPHPLNELNPDFRIHRWEMFLMAKGINMPDEYYKEYPEEYGKVIGGWLGQMYQRGEATRRRKDNGMIELYADQDIAMHFFTKGSSGKPTN